MDSCYDFRCSAQGREEWLEVNVDFDADARLVWIRAVRGGLGRRDLRGDIAIDDIQVRVMSSPHVLHMTYIQTHTQ